MVKEIPASSVQIAGYLDVGPRRRMPDEKPAGAIIGVWEKAMHAGLLHGWIKDDLSLPVFVRNLIVVVDGYAAKGLAVGCQTISIHAIVRTIRDGQQTDSSQKRPQQNSLEPWAGPVAVLVVGFIAFDRDHPQNYTRPRTGPEAGALTILHKKLGSICSSPASNGYGIDDKIQQKAIKMRAVVPHRFEECK
jgi:hypothetical protein